MEIDELLKLGPYSLAKPEKEAMLNQYLLDLTRYHYSNSLFYKRMIDATGFDIREITKYENIPFLPVRMFKEVDLLSVPKEEVIKTMTSSGTTGQAVSKIYLDRETSSNQTKVLTRIVSDFIGNKRVPMLILDSSEILKNRLMFSARGAGILGFSMFGSQREYAFDENMSLNIDSLDAFLEKNNGKPIFIFGFTFMIWQHFYKELKKTNYRPDFSKAVMIHGGGWKKLQNESISSDLFKAKLNDVCGILPENIHDYYGMVEQTGSIFMECQYGYMHTSIFSDVIIRRASDFDIAEIGEKGILEVISILPKSYPGHVLLTEDEGVLHGEDDCKCGRLGKYFSIHGRIKNAEIRGCSDAYATKFN